MGEAKRRRRQQKIGEHMELRPGEPIVLKLFTGHDFLDLLLSGAVDLGDEERQEKLCAVRTVAQRATSDSPPHCVICQDVTVFPSWIGFARSASRSRVGVVFVVCLPCSTASEDIRQDVLEALGEEEIKTSSWAR
jgi:hypothetical protein